MGKNDRLPRPGYSYMLDVLTNGSEGTGHGSLFLTVLKQQSSVRDDGATDHLDNDHVVARYALSGVGDLTSRLASDQKYSLAKTRAIFGCTERLAGADYWGLPGVLFALQVAGAAELTIVTAITTDDTTDRLSNLVDLLHGHCRYPQVTSCHVPTNHNPSSKNPTWWKVYQDDYLLVHAQRVVAYGVTYLYTLLHADTNAYNSTSMESLLLLPPTLHPSTPIVRDLIHSAQQVIVLDDCHHPAPVHAKIMAGIALQVTVRHAKTPTAPSSFPWFGTTSSTSSNPLDDPYLLQRARRQAQAWHNLYPRHFPWVQTRNDNDTAAVFDKKTPDDNLYRPLQTGTSVRFIPVHEEKSTNTRRTFSLEEYNRLDLLIRNTNNNHNIKQEERATWPRPFVQSLDEQERDLLSLKNTNDTVDDDNEIFLSDEEEEEEAEEVLANDNPQKSLSASVPPTNQRPLIDLICLGTGCASPSPYRGASGYVVTMATGGCMVLEVGEGFVTQWNRYKSQSLLDIKCIWISHAHWDHYGGLLPLLSALHELRLQETGPNAITVTSNRTQLPDNQLPPKRRRCNDTATLLPPILMVPDKVLAYLEISCGRDGLLQLCRPMPLSRQNAGQVAVNEISGINYMDSVRVRHSCKDAFGVVIGLSVPFREPYLLCFSGDTLPCTSLVRACRQAAQTFRKTFVDGLIHEATFDDTQLDMARSKKHSTVRQALRVAMDIQPRRLLLLTHFSQRYDHPNDMLSVNATTEDNIDEEYRNKAIFAFDGLQIVLQHDTA